MSMNLGIDELVKMSHKYGFEELAKSLTHYRDEADHAKFTVGLVGESFNVVRCLKAILPSVSQIMNGARNGFVITIAKGDNPVFLQMTPEGEKSISHQALHELLTKKVSLDTEEVLPLIVGRLYLQDNVLDNINLKVIKSVDGLNWAEILLDVDFCGMALAAIKLFSSAEKKLIMDDIKGLPQEYLLMDLEQLPDSDRKEVLEEIQDILPGAKVTKILDATTCDSVWQSWASLSQDALTLSKHRHEAITTYGAFKLVSRLTELKKVRSIDEQKISSIMRRLETVNNQLSSKRNSIIRSLRISYLEPAKVEIKSELLNFNLKMREDLKTGIEEEENVRQLRNAIDGFVAGSWQEFIEGVLVPQWEKKGSQISKLLEQSIYDSFDDLLYDVLSEEEYQDISRLLYTSLHTPNIVIDGGRMIDSDNILYTAPSGNKTSLRSLLPAVFFAAGGIAILGHMLLPGAVLALAGYNVYSKMDSEMKEQLLKDGIEMSNHCLLQYEKYLDENFTEVVRNIDSDVERGCNAVISFLMNILEKYQGNNQAVLDDLAEIEQDIALLSCMGLTDS